MALMPGADLFTRRRMQLTAHWMKGKRRVLDAGFGNGWFSYLAYRSGADVVAVNFAEADVKKATAFYNIWKKVPSDRLRFVHKNLYEIDSFEPGFDEIICYEVLEHIKDDDQVCRSFYRLLRPGGVLHLCCPNAEHPKWANETLDLEEKGYHVRPGYTLDSYKRLLEPIGFRVVQSEAVGGPLLVHLNDSVAWVRRHVGDALSMPLVFVSEPFIRCDPRHPKRPYCLYVKAVKS